MIQNGQKDREKQCISHCVLFLLPSLPVKCAPIDCPKLIAFSPRYYPKAQAQNSILELADCILLLLFQWTGYSHERTCRVNLDPHIRHKVRVLNIETQVVSKHQSVAMNL